MHSVKSSMRHTLLPLIFGVGAVSLLARPQTTNMTRPFEHGLSCSVTNLITAPEAKKLELSFAVTNTSASAINPTPWLTASVLTVNGKPMTDWPLTVANGPRDSKWTSLPAGDQLSFGYAMGEHFTSPGVYTVVWIVEGCASKPLTISIGK